MSKQTVKGCNLTRRVRHLYPVKRDLTVRHFKGYLVASCRFKSCRDCPLWTRYSMVELSDLVTLSWRERKGKRSPHEGRLRESCGFNSRLVHHFQRQRNTACSRLLLSTGSRRASISSSGPGNGPHHTAEPPAKGWSVLAPKIAHLFRGTVGMTGNRRG